MRMKIDELTSAADAAEARPDAASLRRAAAAAVALADEAARNPDLDHDQRAEASRVARSDYMAIARTVASGGGFRLEIPGDDPAGPVEIVMEDGGRFDARGFVRRLVSDWRRVFGG
ncbi:hypothetical protein [Inquilinus sp. CAU 1745]|uniref:hypothetical protein n=1 Tax=Inquilinus sp. CAU 1745 TaxID=3140369 RepID=UPI00325BC011